MSQSSYTAAVIGVGKPNQPFAKGGGHAIGHVHAMMFRRSPRVRLVAGADINQDNLAYYQKQFEVPQGFADYNEMLRTAKPDIVSIGTYVGLHRPIIEAAARAGVKGILCEKPFLASPADHAAVRRIVAETGVKIVVGHIRRFWPTWRRVRELITQGYIGQPIMYLASTEGWDLQEMGSHWIDGIRFFSGDRKATWVMGQARVRDFRGYGHAMEEHAIAYWEFDDGSRALVDGGKGLKGDLFTITGTAGSIHAGEQKLVLNTIAGQRTEDYSNQPPEGWSRLGVKDGGGGIGWNMIWDMTLNALIQWIEGGGEPTVSMNQAMASQEIAFGAYLSALRGDRMDLPLQADDVTEYPVELLARRGK
jgi:predicted dehydrogenase